MTTTTRSLTIRSTAAASSVPSPAVAAVAVIGVSALTRRPPSAAGITAGPPLTPSPARGPRSVAHPAVDAVDVTYRWTGTGLLGAASP